MDTRGGRDAGRRARPAIARWLVPRAVGPLTAVPVAALAATICALAVLPTSGDEARHGAETKSRPHIPPSSWSAQQAPHVALAPPRPAAGGRAAAPRSAAPAAGGTERAALLAAAISADETARAEAISGLRVLAPDPVALDTLAKLVDDPTPFVSAEAAMTLASLPDGRRLIVGRLRGADDPGLVHVVCIEALRDHGAPDDLPTLERLATTQGPVGDAAAMAVRAICARAGVESPLPDVEPLGEPRPERD